MSARMHMHGRAQPETNARPMAKVLSCLHNRPEFPVPGADID